MFEKYKKIILAFVMGIALPISILFLPPKYHAQKNQLTENGAETQDTLVQTLVTMPVQQRQESAYVTVKELGQMRLEEYIVGVVLAEMPPSFHLEALKAQSVVARTYTLKRQKLADKHPDADVCTDSACCQAYITKTDFLNKGGTKEEFSLVSQAVQDTQNQVLTYEQNLIEATYFSCSGGRTEAALTVWGADIPYLQAQESPGEENAPVFTDTVTFSREQIKCLLGTTWTGNAEAWIGDASYTTGGGVERITLGDEIFSGTQLRTLLQLRSTAFELRVEGDLLAVTTKGFGHRVGMSQYGADAMADLGSSWQEILAYYYPGTEITVWPTD